MRSSAIVMMFAAFASAQLAAQWVNYPTPGVPRRADGKANMTAPAPRLANGKPDLSGIWMTAEPNRGAGRGTQPPADIPDEAGDQQLVRARESIGDVARRRDRRHRVSFSR